MSKKEKFSQKKSIRVIPLGGCQEIGKNSTLFEYGEDLIAVDFGVMFPEEGMHGVDLVIPDMSYLVEKAHKFKALILTHGHEDHIGAIPYLVRNLNVPIYGTKFTLGLVQSRLEEHKLEGQLNVVEHRKPFQIGSLRIEMIRNTHSIVDSSSILIETPIGKILHTGDFKIEHSPVDGKKFDFYRFAQLGEERLLLLLSDSTNVKREGYTPSERGVVTSMRESFQKTQGRIFVATFASNIHRIQIVVDLAIELGKKIAVVGRSMENNIQIADDLGYLYFPKKIRLSLEEIAKTPRDQTILICTGTQGEPMSVLSLMAWEKHKFLSISPGDMVVISASVIPGNERVVSKIVNRLLRAGAIVIYEAFEDVHVSGHGYREELKMMISLTRPRFFLPVHGEYRNLLAHVQLAQEMEVPHPEIMQDGDIIEITPEELRKVGKLDLQEVFVDGKGVGDIGSRVIQDRHILSQDGIVVVILSLNKENGSWKIQSDLVSRGFVYLRESSELFSKAESRLQNWIMKCSELSDFYLLKSEIRSNLQNFFYQETQRKPMIVVRIVDLDKVMLK